MFFNVGSGEVLVILLVALLVLGPDKLPDAMRQAGRWMGEIRKVSDGFRAEVRSAMDDPLEAAARERGAKAVADSKTTASGPADQTDTNVEDTTDSERTGTPSSNGAPGSNPSNGSSKPSPGPYSGKSTTTPSTNANTIAQANAVTSEADPWPANAPAQPGSIAPPDVDDMRARAKAKQAATEPPGSSEMNRTDGADDGAEG